MKGTLYALTRNKNDIDSKEKLASMLQQVSETGAAFIDGKNILADSIFARQISASAITTEHMTAGSIKGDRIEVGTLNGDRITANTITSNMIHTAGLDAGVIKTGTISAGNGVSVINMTNGEFSLAGGKIGYVAATDRLYLGMGTLYMGEMPIEEHNRMVGSRQSAEIQKTAITNEKQALDARYASLYNSSSLTGILKTDLSDEYNNATTGYTARYNNLTTALNAVIEAPENTTIAEFATLQSNVATATHNHTAAVFSLNTALELASKTDVSDQIETKSRTFTSTPVVPYNRGDIWKNGTSVYVCSTARSTGVFLLAEWTLTADKTTVQRINDDTDTQRIEGRKMHFTNEVLMDDAWIDDLVANSIVVTKIQATELDAGKITTGSLNASLITTGSLDAARITTGVISAGNGKSTINMSTGAFNFGSEKIAFDGTTLSLNVDSLKITNSSVATQTYASIAAATAKTEAISAAASDATSKINSIEIGGRNLALGTSSDFTYATVGMYSGNLAGVATSQSIYTLEELGVQVGDTMTVSMYVGESEGGYGGAFRIDDQVGSNKYSTYKVAKNGYASETFTILEGTTEIRLYTAGIGNSGASEDFVLPVKEFKLEKGNKATAWMPAPEDVAYDIEQKADSTAVAEAINGVSSSVSGAQAIANAKLDKSAYDNFIKEYGEYKVALAADQSVAAGNLQAAQTAVASIQKEMGDMKESWIFNNGTKIEATGNGMLISDGNPSGMNMLLSQNRLSFFDGGVEVVYIADKTMKINHGIFVKSAQIGSHLISTSPANSEITIVSFVGEG